MELTAIIEALMVASDDPLPASEIARLIRARVAEAEDEVLAQEEVDEQGDYTAEEKSAAEDAAPKLSPDLAALKELSDLDVVEAIGKLNESYQQSERSFRALERAKGWKIYTAPEFGEFVKHLFPGRKPKRLSGPAMETLAVVAYRQPVTKSAIDAVRGVSSDGMLQKLLDLELVKIGGRADLPGRPLLYETTDYFFEHFGIKSPEELPNAMELRTMELPEAEEEPEGSEAAAEDQPSEEKQATLAELETTGSEADTPGDGDDTTKTAEAPRAGLAEDVEDFAQPEQEQPASPPESSETEEPAGEEERDDTFAE